MKKITIVTVCYNCQDSIEETLKSVVKQDYPSLEYIIIDGKSTDGTLDIVHKYQDHIAVLVSEKDQGIYDAMNKGLLRATGEWIFFLNSGDVFHDTHVLSALFAENNTKDSDVCWGNYDVRWYDRILHREATLPFFKNKSFYHGMGFTHQAVFVRTHLAKSLMFDTNYKCCADYNMMIQLYRSGAQFLYIPITIALVEGRGGFSVENRKKQFKETALILGILHSPRFKIFYHYCCLKMLIKSIIGRK